VPAPRRRFVMNHAVRAPYGSWASPITPALVAAGQVELSEPTPVGDATYWLESRPEEGGRTAIMRHTPATGVDEITPPDVDCRSRVHEYGGGAYTVVEDATVYLSRFDDQRLWRLVAGQAPRPVTAAPDEPATLRYADACPTPDGRNLICVRESHEPAGVVNELVAIATDGADVPVRLQSGHDFYASPRLSADGQRLAWIAWDHPRLPWDGTELWVGQLADGGTVMEARRVAGGSQESIFQPEWSPDGGLHFVSDRTGWWNLYREREGQTEPLCPMDAEAGEPQWQFRQSTYAFLPDGRIACVVRSGADQRLILISPGAGSVEALELPYTSFDVPYLRSCGHRLTFIAGAPTEPSAVVSLDVRTGEARRLRASLALDIPGGCISVPAPITFPTGDGETAHALLYPPANDAFAAPEGELPPAIVVSHGGPTGQATTSLDLRVQLWTSRGFAVVDVDYRGSTGYGRAYRERLRSNWGIADVEDCVNAARHLDGVVDLDRLIIRGASAGGYTTLCALTFHDVFRAGASWFGVADLEALALETHKFESHYLDGLIGPYPEAADRYRARSPIYAVERLRRPMILFQGLLDDVVPATQTELMVRALGAAGIPHVYMAFENEHHGFRRAENVTQALEAELRFYRAVFGLQGHP
jgi:dipeptidyl aminopeptidase/acylaminoacyl peptidase